MKEYFDILLTSSLFEGLSKDDLEQFLSCANFHIINYLKGETILMAGFPVREIGIILSGDIEASQEDFSGDRVIISHLSVPEMFGEVLACSVERRSPVTVTALSKTNGFVLRLSPPVFLLQKRLLWPSENCSEYA